MPSTVIHQCLCLFTAIIPPPTPRQTNYFCIASHKEQLDTELPMYPRVTNKKKDGSVCHALHGLITEEQGWVHENWMNTAKEWVQLEQAILAQALGTKRKPTAAFAKEVAWLLTAVHHRRVPRGAHIEGRVKRGHNYEYYCNFTYCSSFLPFHFIINRLWSFALIQPYLEIRFEVPHFRLTQSLGCTDVTEQQVVCWWGEGQYHELI